MAPYLSEIGRENRYNEPQMRRKDRSAAYSAVVFVVSMIFLVQFVRVFSGQGLFTDEAFYLSMAHRITLGQVMYRDFYNVYMPLPFYVAGLMFKITDSTFICPRLLVVTMISLGAGIAFSIMYRGLKCGYLSIVPSFFLVSLTYPFWKIFTPRYFTMFLGLAAVAFVFRYIERKKDVFLLSAGLMSGFNAMSLQSDGAMFLLSTTVFFAFYGVLNRYSGRRIGSIVLKYYVGALLAAAPFLVYFGLKGGLFQFFYNTGILIFKNLVFISQTSFYHEGFVYIESFAHSAFQSPLSFTVALFSIVGLVLLGTLPIFIVFYTLIKSAIAYLRRKTLSADKIKVLYLALVGAALLGAILLRANPIYFMWISFFWLSILTYDIKSYLDRNKRIKFRKWIVLSIVVTMVSWVFILDVSWVYSIQEYYSYPVYVPGEVLYSENRAEADDMNSLKSYFEKHVPPDEVVLGYGWGGSWLYFLGRNNQFVCDVFHPYLDHERLRDAVRLLFEQKVPYVIWDRSVDRYNPFIAESSHPEKILDLVRTDPVGPYIREHYKIVREYPAIGVKIFRQE